MKYPRLSGTLLLGAGGLFVLFLTGCGDERPRPSPPPTAYHAASRTLPRIATASGAGADPLLSDADQSAGDPLLSGGHADPDPLQRGDPLQGRAMPTDHSHWLRGSIRDADLTVLLNGVRQGVYSGLVDKDITMSLRRGINSVTFVYEPHQTDSAGQMDLVESEHHPPIPPLATFQSQPPAGDTALKTTTQTFTFFAK